jgi:isoleucyl-tRNA synthetase
VICHGIVLGSDGQKMSKSLRNYPDVNEVFESDGSDAMRWFLMSSPILRGGNLVVTHEAIREATRNVLLPYWSSYYFFTLYANAVKKPDFKPRLINILDVTNLETLDSYILAVTHNLVADMTDCLEDFKISESCALIQEYLDTLTNWYIRNTRSRFWDEDETAFNVLYTCLELVSRVMAPLAPMITEKVWRGLVSISDTANLPESVHLAEWPHIASVSSKLESTSRHTESHNVLSQLKNDDLIATMSKVRHIVTAGLSVRKLHNIRVRQPLASITVYASKHSSLSKYSTLIEKELNIKEVQFVGLNEIDESEVAVSKVLVVNARALGPRVGKNVQTIIKAAKAGSWTLTKSGHPVVTTDTGEDYTLTEAEYTMSQVEDSSKLAEGHFGAMVSGDDFIVVDTNLTTELENEGIARDLIREIQETRKTTGLEIDDRIDLALSLPLSLYTAAEAFKDMISAEALATSWTLSLVEKAEDQKITVKKA